MHFRANDVTKSKMNPNVKEGSRGGTMVGYLDGHIGFRDVIGSFLKFLVIYFYNR